MYILLQNLPIMNILDPIFFYRTLFVKILAVPHPPRFLVSLGISYHYPTPGYKKFKMQEQS